MPDLKFNIDADILGDDQLATLTADLRSANEAVEDVQTGFADARSASAEMGQAMGDVSTAVQEFQWGSAAASESAAELGDTVGNTSDEFNGFEDSTEGASEKARAFGSALNNDAANALGSFGIRLGDLSNPLTLAANTMQAVIGKTEVYADQVQKLGRNAGISATEASVLIQVADDAKVSYEDLTAATRILTDKGLQPNIETLAKLSDQYLAIQDPIERGRFAADHFGRGWQQMTGLLEQGGPALLAAGEGVRATGQIMDEEGVAKAERYRLALDNLQDHVDGLIYQAGPLFMDFLATSADGFNNLVGLVNIAYISVGRFTGAISEEAAQQKYAAVAAGDWFAIYSDGQSTITDTTEALTDNTTQTAHHAEIVGNSSYAMASYALTMQGVTQALDDKAAAERRSATAADLLSVGLSGRIQPALENYQQTQADVAGELAKAQAELEKYQRLNGTTATVTTQASATQAEYALAVQKASDAQAALSNNTDPGKTLALQVAAEKAAAAAAEMSGQLGGTSTVTLDYSAKIADAQGKVDEFNGKLIAAKDALHAATDELIFQKAAAGLSTQAALDLARGMGRIDEQAYATASAVEALRQQHDQNHDGTITDAEGARKFAEETLNLRERINNLTDELADGKITQEDYKAKMDVLVLTAGNASGAILTVTDAINGLPNKDVQINFHYNTTGTPPAQYGSEDFGGTWTAPSSTGPAVPTGNYGGAQADGGDYIVSQPTWFMAGDAGPERATFTPLRGGGGNEPSASGPTINIKSIQIIIQPAPTQNPTDIAEAVSAKLNRRLNSLAGVKFGS